MGDLYSVSWMENAEDCDLRAETLAAQFELVRWRTSANWSYVQGSHAMEWGDLRMARERAGAYEGPHWRGKEGSQARGPSPACRPPPPAPASSPSPSPSSGPQPDPQRVDKAGSRAARRLLHGAPSAGQWARVAQRDADLVPRRVAVARAAPGPQRLRAEVCGGAARAGRAAHSSASQWPAWATAAPCQPHVCLPYTCSTVTHASLPPRCVRRPPCKRSSPAARRGTT
jgi:hypothetical protein